MSIQSLTPFILLLCFVGLGFAFFKFMKNFKELKAVKLKAAARKQKKLAKNKINPYESNDDIAPEDEVKATTIPSQPISSGAKEKKLFKDFGSHNEFMVLRKEEKIYKICIVDDSKTARYTMKEALNNQKNFEIFEANDGLDAYQKIINKEPDLIITDIEMPNMDGFELLSRIRANLKISQIPVLMVTANLDIHVEIGDKQGANGFLTKPYDKKDLIEQIEYLLHF